MEENKMIHFTFDEQKATDAASYLLALNGGGLPCSELLRRLYIADRISLSEYHSSITTDSYSSTGYGPVCSNIYAYIRNYSSLSSSSLWRKAICIDGGKARLIDVAPTYDMLSEEEKDILDHANGRLLKGFPECKEPGEAITIEDIINAVIHDELERVYALADIELSAEIQRLNYRNR
jgi:hypothetical protein